MDAVADKNMEEFAKRILDKFSASTVAKPGAVAEVLKSIRWEPRPDRNPPSIVIMRRGSKIKGVSNVLAVISATGEFSDLYPSWEPVLADWKRKRSATAGKVSHSDLSVGNMPVSRKDEE